MTRLVAAVIFLALNAYIYHFFAPVGLSPSRENFDSFPMTLGEWVCPERETIPPEIALQLGATDTFVCNYRRASGDPGAVVDVYIGYHATQFRKEGGGNSRSAIHTPKHCLPGAGWDVIDGKTIQLDLPGLPQRPAFVNRLVIAKGNLRQLSYYWYQSRGRVIAQDYMKMLYLFWDRATTSRTDGSLVRFTVPIPRSGEKRAEANLREVASQVVPLLPRYLPQ
jgi:EpsI family protein